MVYDLARAQAELGHETTVFTTDYNGTIPAAAPPGTETTAQGVLIRYFRASGPRWFRSADLRRALVQAKPDYDILHSHNTFLALNRYAAEARSRWGRPLFYHVHGALDPLVVNRGGLKRLRKRVYISLIERRNLNRADGIFALTGSEVDQIRRYGVNAPIWVMPNGVWPEEMPAAADGERFRSRLGIAGDRPIILYLGRIVPKKGLHLLLHALAELQPEHPEVALVLAGDRQGDPNYVRRLERIISENNLGSAVFWADYLNEAEKRGAWAAATLFSHPSESEGMAMSVLEAMAAGLPVIVSRECYMTKAAAAGAVIEVENNVSLLCSAMASLLGDAELRRRVGDTARHFVEQYHSWPHIARQIVQVYDRALSLLARQ